jgi:hypothetical protein
VRHVALVCGCAIGALSTNAVAQAPAEDPEVARLVADGEALAKAGNFSAAIEMWKDADRRAPRARHACLIGLAYTRREAWPQAEIFLASCRQRATADDPVPAWLDTVEGELATKLAQSPVAAVTLAASAPATFKVSSFAPDETVGPRVIHLALGQHTITASADGFKPSAVTVDIDSREPRTITIELEPLVSVPDPERLPPPPPPPPPPRTRRSKLPWIVMGAGGALALGGGFYHATVLRGAWNDLEQTTDRDFYDGTGDEAWRSARRNTIILYSAAAVAIGTGVALRAMGVGDRREAPIAIGVTPRDGGGVVTVGWER